MYVYKDDLTKTLEDKEKFTYNNIKYPSNYNKGLLDFLALVTLTDEPNIDEATQKITGYTIDETYTQVWTVEDKTAEEQKEYIDQCSADIDCCQNILFEKYLKRRQRAERDERKVADGTKTINDCKDGDPTVFLDKMDDWDEAVCAVDNAGDYATQKAELERLDGIFPEIA